VVKFEILEISLAGIKEAPQFFLSLCRGPWHWVVRLFVGGKFTQLDCSVLGWPVSVYFVG
jgi:hypothetical protein